MREIPEPVPFLSWHGAQIGVLWVFPTIKIAVVCQVHYVTCIYCILSVEINTQKMLYGALRSWTHLFCVYLCVCGLQNPQTLNLSPHG